MITRRNQSKGFTTQESINVDRPVDYLDRFSVSFQFYDTTFQAIVLQRSLERWYPKLTISIGKLSLEGKLPILGCPLLDGRQQAPV